HEFSKVTGTAVLVDDALTEGRRSTAVEGRFTEESALHLLLSGSGLVALYSGGDAFTVRPVEVRGDGERRRQSVEQGAPAGESYAGVLQAALARALCRSTLTQPGRYRVAVQLWIGAAGQVEHVKLLSSTGEAERDLALVESLRLLVVDRP